MSGGRLKQYGDNKPDGNADKGLERQNTGTDAGPKQPTPLSNESAVTAFEDVGKFREFGPGQEARITPDYQGERKNPAPTGGPDLAAIADPLAGHTFMENTASGNSPKRGGGETTPDAKTMIREGRE